MPLRLTAAFHISISTPLCHCIRIHCRAASLSISNVRGRHKVLHIQCCALGLGYIHKSLGHTTQISCGFAYLRKVHTYVRLRTYVRLHTYVRLAGSECYIHTQILSTRIYASTCFMYLVWWRRFTALRII